MNTIPNLQDLLRRCTAAIRGKGHTDLEHDIFVALSATYAPESAPVPPEQQSPAQGLVEAVRKIAHSHTDNEMTARPVWWILDPQQMMSARRPHQLYGMFHGPFWSRERATEFMANTRYRYGDNALVYCGSANTSPDMQALYDVSAALQAYDQQQAAPAEQKRDERAGERPFGYVQIDDGQVYFTLGEPPHTKYINELTPVYLRPSTAKPINEMMTIAQYHRAIEVMCNAQEAISNALGLSEDDGCDPANILEAIEALQFTVQRLFDERAAQPATVGELPTFPSELINLIGEYGMSRSDRRSEATITHRWQLLIAGIKDYAREAVRLAMNSDK